MKPKNRFAEIGMRSLNRVTAKVFEDAREKNIPLPVWENGKVEYMVPEQAQIDELLKKVITGEKTKLINDHPSGNE